ncbi:class I SAM-dependent methyltransferase [Cryomorpha ignava]|uniref:Class I SAM-dependent methyltransferase n=1 Tax=Cryomorpha ignava TaxID=101383 RepID=A0A7K3WKR4_9FLAO|nr:class I SAM-dependent methyltransferase [Cryomorpha ignava]NEN22128.1 class I SAM-dependent methyltransferase [Cryomorpha ignava]
MTVVLICPICESKSFQPALSLKDYSISKEEFKIVRCTTCSFLLTNPRPTDEDLSKYYESEDYISHSDTKKGFINKLYHQIQKINLRLKYKAYAKYVPRGTWMDYGAGTGAYLDFLKSKNISCEGFEPDEKARKIGSQKGIKIQDAIEYKSSSKEYASITMWHVLEHVTNLNEIILKHKSNLIEGGILTIAVPNHNSFDAQYYKNYWAAYDVPRHLWHFTEKNVRALLKKNGFEHIKTKPMIFDSYYVSMLSEKYKGSNLIRGIFSGAISNLKARTTKHSFSSQIYIFRKKRS